MKSLSALNTGIAAGVMSLSILLSGCGQTGPLYMPKPPAKAAVPPPPPHSPQATTPAQSTNQ
ncbi:MAG: LPS translocon maturation chaperone LptM [Gammaproteobacteria bacterium]